MWQYPAFCQGLHQNKVCSLKTPSSSNQIKRLQNIGKGSPGQDPGLKPQNPQKPVPKGLAIK
eukprot:574714-Prorocentrum_lima.AAC.1